MHHILRVPSCPAVRSDQTTSPLQSRKALKTCLRKTSLPLPGSISLYTIETLQSPEPGDEEASEITRPPAVTLAQLLVGTAVTTGETTETGPSIVPADVPANIPWSLYANGFSSNIFLYYKHF